jgi:xanthine/CO dehydrogenase XdhC/CoxF family maturation factor
MTTWLAALRRMQQSSIPAVLVTVAQIQGSTPRESGARMLYTADAQFDTIGGGHLEWRAAQIARAMLLANTDQLDGQRRLERIALGPSLGQCCGGVVFLCFERIASDAEALRLWQELEQSWTSGNDRWRALPLDHPEPMQLLQLDGQVDFHVLGIPIRHGVELLVDFRHQSNAVLHRVLVGFDARFVLVKARVGVVSCHAYVDTGFASDVIGVGLYKLGFIENVFVQLYDVDVVTFTHATKF